MPSPEFNIEPPTPSSPLHILFMVAPESSSVIFYKDNLPNYIMT